MATMTVGMITFDTTDASTLAAWWARQVGGAVQDNADGWFATVTTDGPTLAFQRVPDPTPGKNRIHVDLTVEDRAAATTTLVADGAQHVADHEHDGFRWTVLADPEGNQFCIAQADGA
jgi:catechol 2,3-dioxygenase-like lactoylglutathione lyase family enzyme